jgi:multidrug efflux pump subunit AcrB
MFSLLTTQQKKNLKKQYRFRFLTTFFVLGTLVVLLWIISLIPTYVVLHNERLAVEAQVQEVKNSTITQNKNELEQLDKYVALLGSFVTSAETVPSNIIRSVTQKAGSEIQIASIVSNRSDDELLLTIQGEAETRDALREFIDAIESDERYGEASLPLSNFVKEVEIPFTITTNIITE